MRRKAVLVIMLAVLLIGMLTLAFDIAHAQPPETEWTRTYGGDSDDWTYSIVEISDGGYALAGYTDSFGLGVDAWLVKADSSGNVQWNRTYGGEGEDRAWSFVETGDGGYALAGYTNSFGAGGRDAWLVKIAGPPPVGGIYIPVNKLELLTPWVTLAVAAVAITITLAYAKKRWTRKAIIQKQK